MEKHLFLIGWQVCVKFKIAGCFNMVKLTTILNQCGSYIELLSKFLVCS